MARPARRRLRPPGRPAVLLAPWGRRRASRPAPIGTCAGFNESQLDPLRHGVTQKLMPRIPSTSAPTRAPNRGGFDGTRLSRGGPVAIAAPLAASPGQRSGLGAGCVDLPGGRNAKKNPVAKSHAAVAAGKKLTVEKACTACHGESGKGDGPGAAPSTRSRLTGPRQGPAADRRLPLLENHDRSRRDAALGGALRRTSAGSSSTTSARSRSSATLRRRRPSRRSAGLGRRRPVFRPDHSPQYISRAGSSR